MRNRHKSIGLVGAALGLAFVFGACGEPTGSYSGDTTTVAPTSTPAVVKALPLGDKNQAQSNQKVVDNWCPPCGLFADATPVK